MSRSRQQTPIIGNCAGTEKDDKRREHGRWRTRLREALAHDDWDRAAYDVRDSNWGWTKDGKRWVGGPRLNPADLRK